MHTREEKMEAFGRLLDIMDEIREKCPWNRAQTFDSLRPMTLEEIYELSDAVLRKSDKDLEKELGDVLLHIVFYSKIAQEEGKFDIADVCSRICEKMIYRHPHVFGGLDAADEEEVARNWEMLKTKEKGGNKTILSGVPDSMPPVLKAVAMQKKARDIGFVWEERSQVWDKVREEQQELEVELGKDDYEHSMEELGDFMFATINAARLYGLDPDTALNAACDKFRRRFTYLEGQTIRKGRKLTDMTLAEMDAIWDEGKAKGL